MHRRQGLIALAQVVVGTSLGQRFRGISGNMIRRARGLSVASVVFMMALGALCAWMVSGVTGIPFDHMLISFAPGGVTEMSLVALSLAASPALVTLHHVVRIFVTVFVMAIAARRLGLTPPPSQPG